MAGGTGFGYGIDLSGLDSAIDSADKKLKKLAVTGENAARVISDAFIDATQSIKDFGLALQSNGFGAIKKGSKDAINAINQMSQAIAKMNNDTSSSGQSKTLSVFGNALDNLMNKINRLKNEIDLFREWEGGQLLNNSDYVNIGKVTDEINRLMSAYIALDNAQKSISQTQSFKQHVDKLSRQDLDSQRYKDSMKAMREFYVEQDKEGRRAVKEAEKNAKQEQKAYEKAYKERAKLYQQENQKKNQTFEGSLSFSKTANTINRQIVAIKNLEAARNSLSRTDADYTSKVERLNDEIRRHQTEIDKAKGKSDKLRKSHTNLMDISGQLARRLALVFSVSQISGYMRKLVEVRGEFELQQKALQAIVQNVDEANKLWNKTVALAVKSPFRVKELVTYTKQLAAYRVETDKLYDTTKMLADVSAGLGVDMQRLILAFGQVKAANYLRGTELRQFSEAGINILGELATYFTELEGRAVSVGDVFERVSRRMVTFADVEEIFRRITSEGGTFYNMQALQAETLKGQMSNLRDSIDIMLNDIGKENEDMMKGMVQGVRRIVENWEYLAVIIKDVAGVLIISSLGSFIKGLTLTDKALKKVLESGRGFVAMGAKLKTLVKSLWASITTHPWLALGAAILSVVTVIGQMIRVSNKLKRELSDLSMQGAFDASRSVAEYKRLASVVTDVTATYDEQKEALSVLQRKYADILPDHLLQADTIRDLQGDYEDATNAIYEYIAAKTKEKQIETISGELGSDVEERATDLADDIKKALSKVAPNITKADVLPIVNKLRELIQVGDVSVFNVDETIQNLVKEFTGLEISANAWKYVFSAANGEMVTLDNNAVSLVRSISKMNSAIKGVTSSSFEWRDAFIYNDFNEIRDAAEETRKSLSSLFAIIGDYGKKDKAGNALVSDETYNNTITKLDELFNEVGIKGLEWSSIVNDPFKLQKATTDYNVALWGKMIKEIGEMEVLPSQSGAKSNFIEMLMGEQEAFKGTKFQQEINRILLGLSKEMSVSLEGLNSLFAASDQSVADYAKTVQSTLETLKTNVAEYDNDVAKGVGFSPLDPTKIDLMREQIPMVEDFLELFDIYLNKPSNEDKDAGVKILNKRINLIKEMHKEYLDGEKIFGSDAEKKIAEAYAKTFKEAFANTGINLTGLIIDKEKLSQLQEEGMKSGEVFSKAMLEKMNEVVESNTYIRSASESLLEQLKGDEGFMAELYDDKTKKIIRNAEDFKRASGTVTIGYGHAIKSLEEAQQYFGKILSESEAEEILKNDLNAATNTLNGYLDIYNEVILTQEQYDTLANRTFQGGGAVKGALRYATDMEAALEHFDTLDKKLQKHGMTFAGEFGEDFVKNFKDAETVAERLALILETINLTTRASGSQIDPDLYKGMKKRSQEWAAIFRGDLELVKILEKSAIDVSAIDFTNVEGVIDILERLRPIAEKEGEEAVNTLNQTISKFTAEIGITIKKEQDEKLLDEVQSLFDRYQLTVDLKKLNIPPDLAKSLFDVDYLDLSGLRTAVQAQESKFIGTDMEKEYRDFLKKIEELSRKQREDEAKEFVNFLKNNLNEIKVIQDKGAYNIALADRLFGEGKITSQQYLSSIRQIVDDTNKEVAKINLEKFKDSTTYIKAMGNLAAYSKSELEGMISALQKQVGEGAGNMGTDEILAYYDALEGLIDQYDKLASPFDGGEINDLIEYLNLQKQLNKEKEREVELERRMETINNRLEMLRAKLASQQESGDVEGAKFTQGLIKESVAELKEVNGELVSVTSNITVISERISKLGDGMVKALVVAEKVINEISNVANATTKMFEDIKEIADSLGADTESDGWAKAGYAMEMVGGVSSELSSGLSSLANSDFAGVLASVVGIVIKLISGFAKIHDQDYQEIIEAQAEEVERLGKAYEKLEIATENAFSIEKLQQANAELEKNIELQIASYKAMIAAEKAKKNTDEEQIKAWNEEIEVLTEQWEELKDSLVEGVGGISDSEFRSQTRGFVDAWVSAFKETGDGLSGLEDNFREFFDDVIAEQAALRVTEKYLEPFYKSLNTALNDYELTADESQNLREEADKIMPELSKALELIWTQLGGSQGGTGENLSSLQKGIQGLTEDTGQIIESYLNSVRFYVESISRDTASQLVEVKAMHKLLDSVTMAGHPKGRSGIKVFID